MNMKITAMAVGNLIFLFQIVLAQPGSGNRNTTAGEPQWEREASAQITRTIETQLTAFNEKWYIQYSIANPPEKQQQQFFAPPVNPGNNRIPTEGFIEFADIAKPPSVRVSENPRNPGTQRVTASKAVGKYRIYHSLPAPGSWGVENHNAVVWNWSGSVRGGKLKLDPKVENKMGRDGPIRIRSGDVKTLVAIILGVQPDQVKYTKPRVDNIPRTKVDVPDQPSQQRRLRPTLDPYFLPPFRSQ